MKKLNFLYGFIISLSIFFVTSPAYTNVLVIAPHPDDDILLASGIVNRAVMRGEPVMIVYMTNGDKYSVTTGYTRQAEAVTAEAYLGMTEDNLIFLGYPDGYLKTLYSTYTEMSDKFTAPNGQSTTYGNRGLGRQDYHSYRFGSPADYNSHNIVLDLADIISTFKPDHIFVTSEFDDHLDHATSYELMKLAILSVHANTPSYTTTVHKSIIWWYISDLWPNPIDPTLYFSAIPNFFNQTGLNWGDRESIDVPLSMQSANLSTNPKYRALQAETSQVDLFGFLEKFVHKDEIFWAENLLGSNRPPVPSAGFDQTVNEGSQVQLDGSGSFDPDNDFLSFQWIQIGGVAVQLSNPAIAKPIFTAPSNLSQNEFLTFQLVVNDSKLTSIPDSVNVNVIAAHPVPVLSSVSLNPTTVEGGNTSLGTVTLSRPAPIGGAMVTLRSDNSAASLQGSVLVVSGSTSATFTVSTSPVASFTSVAVTAIYGGVTNKATLTLTTPNLALLATVTVSSETPSYGQLAIKAVDGVIDGYPGDYEKEWATSGEGAGAWIKLTWPSPQVMDRVVLYDRPNLNDQILRATLTFSDGSSFQVGPLDNGGAAMGYTFTPQTITSLTLTVNEVSGTTKNVGLSEIQVFGILSTANNPVPAMTSLSPSSGTAGSSTFTLTVNGGNFVNGSVVRWNGSNRTTTYVTSTQSTATITAADIATAGTASVTVFNPTPGGGTSNAQTFTINNLATTLNLALLATVTASSETPSYGQLAIKAVDGVVDGYPGDYNKEWATSGEGAGAWIKLTWPSPIVVDHVVLYDRPNLNDQILGATLTFSDGSTLQVGPLDNGGAAVGYTFTPQTITSLTLTINEVSGTTHNVGLSEIQVFGILSTANNPVPAMTSLSPSSGTAISSTFTLTVNGGNFVNGSAVRWNGSNRTTTYVTSTQLTATITAADIATVGTASVTVFNPTPGGGTSNAQTFTINNPVTAVTVLNGWTNLYSAAPKNTMASNLAVGNFTVGLGSRRLLLVSVVMEIGKATNPSISATYGGTALTQIGITANSQREIVWMGYLKEAQIGNGSKILAISYSGASGNVSALHVKWASYDSVNQANPVASLAARNSGSNSVTFGSTINYVNNGMTVVVAGNGGSPATGALTATPTFTAGTATTTNAQTSRTFTTARHTATGSYSSSTTVIWSGTTSSQSGLVVVSLQP